jgi:hypothetical protein
MKKHGSRLGRPKGRKNCLKGTMRLAKETGVTPQHLRMVFLGKRKASDKLARSIALASLVELPKSKRKKI